MSLLDELKSCHQELTADARARRAHAIDKLRPYVKELNAQFEGRVRYFASDAPETEHTEFDKAVRFDPLGTAKLGLAISPNGAIDTRWIMWLEVIPGEYACESTVRLDGKAAEDGAVSSFAELVLEAAKARLRATIR